MSDPRGVLTRQDIRSAEKRQDAVTQSGGLFTAATVAAALLERGVPRPAVIQPGELHVRGGSWTPGVDHRGDPVAIEAHLRLVELAIENQHASRDRGPCSRDVSGGELAEEPLRPACIR